MAVKGSRCKLSITHPMKAAQWSALKTALTETRGAFDRANQAAQEAFKQAV